MERKGPSLLLQGTSWLLAASMGGSDGMALPWYPLSPKDLTGFILTESCQQKPFSAQ